MFVQASLWYGHCCYSDLAVAYNFLQRSALPFAFVPLAIYILSSVCLLQILPCFHQCQTERAFFTMYVCFLVSHFCADWHKGIVSPLSAYVFTLIVLACFIRWYICSLELSCLTYIIINSNNPKILFLLNLILPWFISDQMIRNGNVELQAREEEIRFIKMQINEEKRSIAVLRAQTPNKMNLESELVTLQIQVG